MVREWPVPHSLRTVPTSCAESSSRQNSHDRGVSFVLYLTLAPAAGRDGEAAMCVKRQDDGLRESGMLARTVGSGGDSGWPAMIRGEPRTSWQFPTRASPTLPLSLSRSPSCYSPHRLHPPQSLCRAEAAMTGY